MDKLTEGYPVVIEIPVAWGEMDAFQHLNNIVYFRYLESARIAYFEKLNVLDLMTRTGIGPILAATSCKFRMPLTYPDKVLVGAKVTNKVAAEGDGLIVAFNYHENKKAIISDELRQRIIDVEKTVS